MIKVPIGKILSLIGQLIKAIPGGISVEERNALLESLLELAASIAPETIDLQINKRH